MDLSKKNEISRQYDSDRIKLKYKSENIPIKIEDSDITNKIEIKSINTLRYNDKKKEMKDIKTEEKPNLKKRDFFLLRTKAYNTLNYLIFFHSILFCTMILMQYNVYYRYNNNSKLREFFKYKEFFEFTKLNLNNPNEIIHYLLDLFKDNSFLILDKKFEIISNIRITQRIADMGGIKYLINGQMNLNQKLMDKITSFDVLKINPYDKFDKSMEYNQILKNKYSFSEKDCNLKIF